jgi:hypothetical protein
MRKLAFAAALVTLAAPLAASAAEDPVVRVHVFAGSPQSGGDAERKAREKQADAERKSAERARKDLDKALAARHGKRSEDWPEEARRQSEEAWTAELRAALAHGQAKAAAQDLADSAGDLARSLKDEVKDKPRVAVVDAAAEADLTVEVLARASRSGFPAAVWLLYLKVQPAGSAGPGAFAGKRFDQVKSREGYLGQILGSQDLRGAVATIHTFTEAEPYWIIQVVQQGTAWKHVAWTAAEILAAFSSDLAEAEGGARAGS